MEVDTPKKAETQLSSFWAGGLLAVSLVIFQGFLSQKHLDMPALISVSTLALAMPILAYKILADSLRVRKYNTRVQSLPQANASIRTPSFELILFVIGVFSALVGIGAAFLRIYWIAAVIYSVCTLALLIITFFSHVRT